MTKTMIAILLAALPILAFQPPRGVTVLEDVNLIDGTGRAPMAHATIILDGDRIQSVSSASARRTFPKGARILHLSGKTVIPGLIDAHGHLGMTQGVTSGTQNYTEANIRRQLLQYERYGVTTMLSLGLNRDLLYGLRDRQAHGQFPGATILTADRGMGTPGGVPGFKLAPDQLYRPNRADEARRDVQEMAARRPNFVKIWVDDNLGKVPKMKPEVYQAAIDEAHKHGLKVAAHVYYLDDAKRLVRDGVDVLAHSIRNKPVDDELIQLMKQHGTYYIPTLQLEEAFFIYADKAPWMKTAFFHDTLSPELREQFNSPEWVEKIEHDKTTAIHRAALAQAKQNVKRLADAGIPIAFGTDSGAFPVRIQGFAEHRELYLMVSSGLSPLQAIQSATGINARMLGVSTNAGTVEPGKEADLLILNADPEKAIQNTTRIAAVWHRGVEVTAEKTPGVIW